MKGAIRFRDVSFSYPGSAAPALDAVHLDVDEGVFALVCGRTGSGKSTLLRATNGLVPQFTGGTFSGSVAAAGRDTLRFAPREMADAVAFVPQDPAASFVLDKVEDEIAYGMENLGFTPSRMRRRIEDMLDLLDLSHLRSRSVRSISGGERQRVAIAAALAAGPSILVLDEPTSQLDPQGAEDVLAALQRLVHDHGNTVLLAEHRLDRVAGFADLAIECVGGRVSAGAPADILPAAGSAPPVAHLGRLAGWNPVPLTVRDARVMARRLPLPPPPVRPPASGGASIVNVRGLCAGFGKATVLQSVDLDFANGEVVAFMGRNGSGKTTLLRSITGLHAPSSGSVCIDGGVPRPGVEAALCPQEPESLLFKETVFQEVAATKSARGNGRGGTARQTETREILEQMGIDSLSAMHPRDLSAGERLLVATAAVAATDAPVLLLDEPTRGLDPQAKQRLATFMDSYASSGRTVLFATHDVELAASAATRVVMMAGGEVIDDGPPEVVLGDSDVFAPQMTRVFGPGWLTPDQVAGAMRHA